jgi:hypothetical protein
MVLHIRKAEGRPNIKQIQDVTLNITTEEFFWFLYDRADKGFTSAEFWITSRSYEQAKKRKLISRLDEKETTTSRMLRGTLKFKYKQRIFMVRLTRKGKHIYECWIAAQALLGNLPKGD